jgi:hypothetical protein
VFFPRAKRRKAGKIGIAGKTTGVTGPENPYTRKP